MNIRTLAFAAALAFVPAAAMAAPPSVQVKYGDLDLSTPQGLAKLDKRIHSTARESCTSQMSTGSIVKQQLDKKCYQETLQKLQQQVAVRTQNQQKG